MATTPLKKIDSESQGRIKEVAAAFDAGRPLKISEVFLNASVAGSLTSDKTIISGFDPDRILPAIPLNEIVYVELCPSCVTDFSLIKPFLDVGAVIPVLSAPYEKYHEGFIRGLLKYSHVSVYEFDFYRSVALFTEAGGGLCGHCIDKNRTKSDELAKQSNAPEYATKAVDKIYRSLHPYVAPDFELLESLDASLKDNDRHATQQIVNLAWTIHNLRTAQAYDGKPALSADSIEALPQQYSDGEHTTLTAAFVREGLADAMELNIPMNGDVERYLEIAVAERQGISRLIRKVIQDSEVPHTGEVSLSKLHDRIADLNDQIRRKSASTRYILYRAGVEIAGNNKGLLFSGLVAGAIGLAGSAYGCGAVASSGLLMRLLRARMPKVTLTEPLKAAQERIHRHLETPVGVVLSKYLGLDFDAYLLWQIRERIADKSNGQSGAKHHIGSEPPARLTKPKRAKQRKSVRKV